MLESILERLQRTKQMLDAYTEAAADAVAKGNEILEQVLLAGRQVEAFLRQRSSHPGFSTGIEDAQALEDLDTLRGEFREMAASEPESFGAGVTPGFKLSPGLKKILAQLVAELLDALLER